MFNYELFMLKFFNYSILKMRNELESVKASIKKDFYSNKINNYINSDENKKKISDDFDSWTDSEWEKWNQFDKERKEKFKKLYDIWNTASSDYINMGVPLDASFGCFYAFLSEHGINIDSSYSNFVEIYDIGDIIASENFTLKDINSDNIYENPSSHYLYITGLTNDGKIIVSSWGKKYIFDDTNANWTAKVKLKIHD